LHHIQQVDLCKGYLLVPLAGQDKKVVIKPSALSEFIFKPFVSEMPA
jgi:hypothetical protein